MLIKMRSTMAGPDGVVAEGSVIERDDATAQALIDGGYAEAAGVVPAAPVVSDPDEDGDGEGATDTDGDETAALTPSEDATSGPQRTERPRRK